MVHYPYLHVCHCEIVGCLYIYMYIYIYIYMLIYVNTIYIYIHTNIALCLKMRVYTHFTYGFCGDITHHIISLKVIALYSSIIAQ